MKQKKLQKRIQPFLSLMKPLVFLILKEPWVTRGNVVTRSSLSVYRRIICIHELHQDQLIKRKLWPMSTNHGERFQNLGQNQGSTLRFNLGQLWQEGNKAGPWLNCSFSGSVTMVTVTLFTSTSEKPGCGTYPEPLKGLVTVAPKPLVAFMSWFWRWLQNNVNNA